MSQSSPGLSGSGTGSCTNCGSSNVFTDFAKGDTFCRDCGLVLEDHVIDHGKEWHDDLETGRGGSRGAGAPLGINPKLTTTIGTKQERFGHGGWTRKQVLLRNSFEKNLQVAEDEARRIAAQLRLTKTIQKRAMEIYYEAAAKGLARGRKIETLIAGILYYVAKQFGVARTLDEFTQISSVSKKEISRVYRFVVKKLRLDVRQSSPLEYLSRFATSLNLSPKVQTRAAEIVLQAQAKELMSGRGPSGMAAAALYIAALQMGEKRTQREVADVAGVTEVTIRNRYKELLKEL